MVHKAKQVAAYKKENVKKVVDLLKKYPIIGSVNMENLPAAQLQRMKAQLRGKVELFMTKRRLIKIALENAKADVKGIEKLEEYLRGMPALLFTNDNPFTLFKILKKSKSKAPAKAGQTAPSDIVVKAGPTPFAPGPVISELAGLGIKTKVDQGKINIIEDAVVCREGEQISDALAGMLTRLGIEPMEVGLDLVAVYEKGDIFTKSVLDIDEDKFMADLSQAARWAFNLSCEAAYLTDANKELLIQKAFMDSKALAISQGIMADAVVNDVLAKAERQMLSLKSQIPEMPEAPKEEPKAEEKPADAPKEEAKPEEKAEEKKEETTAKPEEKAEEKKEEPKAEEKTPEPQKTETPKPAEQPKEEEKAEEKKEETTEKVAKEKEAKAVEEKPKTAQPETKPEKPAEEKKNTKTEKQEKEKAEMDEVADLAKELVKKGTLRK